MAWQAEGHARLTERLQLTDDLLTRAIALVCHVSLDYGFLAEAYERHALLQGAKVSLLVMLGTVVLNLAFGVGFARLLVSPHKRVR